MYVQSNVVKNTLNVNLVLFMSIIEQLTVFSHVTSITLYTVFLRIQCTRTLLCLDSMRKLLYRAYFSRNLNFVNPATIRKNEKRESEKLLWACPC